MQNTLPPSQTSIALALLVFTQNFSAAVFLSLADVIFTNSLKSEIPKYAPSVDPEVVIAAGSTGVYGSVSKTVLHGVLKAYAESVNRVFYMAASTAVVGFVFCWGMGWKDIRKKDQKEPKEVKQEAGEKKAEEV